MRLSKTLILDFRGVKIGMPNHTINQTFNYRGSIIQNDMQCCQTRDPMKHREGLKDCNLEDCNVVRMILPKIRSDSRKTEFLLAVATIAKSGQKTA